MKSRRLLGAICAVLATVSVALLGAAPIASADQGRAPRAQLMRLIDKCDAANWPAGPGGCAAPGAGSVSFDRFVADLAKGGSGAWWINNREQTINAGDTLHVVNEGGILHSFTEVSAFGAGIVPPNNASLPPGTPQFVPVNPATVFGTIVTSQLVDPNAALDVPAGQLAKGTHKYQCIFHPWMRSVVTVR